MGLYLQDCGVLEEDLEMQEADGSFKLVDDTRVCAPLCQGLEKLQQPAPEVNVSSLRSRCPDAMEQLESSVSVIGALDGAWFHCAATTTTTTTNTFTTATTTTTTTTSTAAPTTTTVDLHGGEWGLPCRYGGGFNRCSRRCRGAPRSERHYLYCTLRRGRTVKKRHMNVCYCINT